MMASRLCGASMLETILAQRFEFLKKRGDDSWFSSLRQHAWDVWRKHYTVADLSEDWCAELRRAASPVPATKAAEKAVQDARQMWRRLAAQAEQQQVTQKEGGIETCVLPSCVQEFLDNRLMEAHPLASLQIALLSHVWWVRAADAAHVSEPLQPPPQASLWDELFTLRVFDVRAEARVEVISGCMAPKGARAQLAHADVGERAHLTWTSMDHAPASDAEAGARRLMLRAGAHCTWREVRLNAGPGLNTSLEKQDGATLEYQGLWGASAATPQVLDWFDARDGETRVENSDLWLPSSNLWLPSSNLWLLGSIQVPAMPRVKTFQLPAIAWPWHTVRVPEDAWRQFCLEQFLMPFLRNLPVEYQTDIVRFAELMDQKSSVSV